MFSKKAKSDVFDKLINQLKQEKIEEDRYYEKHRKVKENQSKNPKEKEYNLNNLIENFNDTVFLPSFYSPINNIMKFYHKIFLMAIKKSP